MKMDKRESNTSLEQRTETLHNISEIEQEKKAPAKKEKKDNGNKTILLTLTAEKKETYKKFFGSKGFSLLQGIRMALDFVYTNVKNGTLSFGESGISYNKLNDL